MLIEEEIISSVVSGVAEGLAASSGGSGKDPKQEKNGVRSSQQSERRFSYPAMVLVGAGALMVALFVVARLLGEVEQVAEYVPGSLGSVVLPILGVVLVALGVAFEVWDARRIWHRPMWRIKNELAVALRTLHIITASTIDSSTSPLEGLKVGHYRWNQRGYIVTLRISHPGNARLTLDSLERLARACPFRYAHAVEVEQFFNRRNSPDGFTIRIYYRSDSDTMERQLEGAKPWQTK